jgi:hypothetical protein
MCQSDHSTTVFIYNYDTGEKVLLEIRMWRMDDKWMIVILRMDEKLMHEMQEKRWNFD